MSKQRGFLLFLLLCFHAHIQAQPSGELLSFEQILTVSVAEVSQVLTLGQAENATDAFDPNVDVPAPPPPPAPNFDARLRNLTSSTAEDYYKDIRLLKENDTFRLSLRPASENNPDITLNWEALPDFQGTLILDIRGETVDLTQAGTRTVSIATSSGEEFDIIYTANTQVGIETSNGEKPEKYSLSQNYPNPFNPQTTIAFSIPERAHVLLKIYTLTGQEMATLVDDHLSAGTFSVQWDASGSPSGVYFYKIHSERFSDAKLLTLIR